MEIGIAFGVALLQKLEMRNLLIHNVKQLIRRPYRAYVVGITDNENKYDKTKGNGGLVMFNYRNDAMTLEAYNYFKLQGMNAKPPIGTRPKYFYLYRLDGEEIRGIF